LTWNEASRGALEAPATVPADGHLLPIEAAVAELRAFGLAFEQARAVAYGESEGKDTRGAVTVVLDADDRVTAVRPHPRWRDLVPVEALGAAVLEAVHAAHGAKTERALAYVKDRTDQPLPAQQRPGPVAASRPDPDLSLSGVVEEIVSTLEAAERLVAERREGIGQFRKGPGEDGAELPARVEAVLSQCGHPVEVRVNPGWAAAVSRTGLGQRIAEAFVEAYAAHDAHASTGSGRPLMPAMSPALTALAEDPAGVLTRLVGE
jgi:DNA-binding protein YbaB